MTERITGVIGLSGGGGAGLFATLIVELMPLPFRSQRRLTRLRAVTAGILTGVMLCTFMLVVPSPQPSLVQLKALSLAIRVFTGTL